MLYLYNSLFYLPFFCCMCLLRKLFSVGALFLPLKIAYRGMRSGLKSWQKPHTDPPESLLHKVFYARGCFSHFGLFLPPPKAGGKINGSGNKMFRATSALILIVIGVYSLLSNMISNIMAQSCLPPFTLCSGTVGVYLYNQMGKGSFLSSEKRNRSVGERQKPRFISFAQETSPPTDRVKYNVHMSFSIEVASPSFLLWASLWGTSAGIPCWCQKHD